MADARPTVFVVDDDASVRDAISNLLESVGLRAKVFASSEEFWKAPRSNAPSCLVVDVRLAGVSGLEFQEQLAKANVSIPIIFITAHGDVPMTSRAMKAGAIEFLMKPFQKDELLAAVHHGLERDRLRRDEHAEVAVLQSRAEQLTSREREVMDLVVTGLINVSSWKGPKRTVCFSPTGMTRTPRRFDIYASQNSRSVIRVTSWLTLSRRCRMHFSFAFLGLNE